MFRLAPGAPGGEIFKASHAPLFYCYIWDPEIAGWKRGLTDVSSLTVLVISIYQ